MIKRWLEEQYDYTFWFATTAKELEERVQQDKPYTELTGIKGNTVQWFVGEGALRVKNLGIHANSQATLAHECVHAANFIYDQIGQRPDVENDEAYAYLVGYVFRQYCKHVKPSWNKEA